MNLIRLSGKVMGRVQGVGFRAFTRKVARQFDLSGWVRNEFDGSVRFEVQGIRENLDKFKLAVGKGPVFSRVDSTEFETLPETIEDKGFSILR